MVEVKEFDRTFAHWEGQKPGSYWYQGNIHGRVEWSCVSYDVGRKCDYYDSIRSNLRKTERKY